MELAFGYGTFQALDTLGDTYKRGIGSLRILSATFHPLIVNGKAVLEDSSFIIVRIG